MDRHTMAGTGAFKVSASVDYLENNCVDDPVKLCEFQKLDGRILKTVDSVFQDVASIDDCRQLCLTAPYRCHSFDYADTGENVCRLSHHALATLTHIQVSRLRIQITPTMANRFKNVSIFVSFRTEKQTNKQQTGTLLGNHGGFDLRIELVL